MKVLSERKLKEISEAIMLIWNLQQNNLEFKSEHREGFLWRFGTLQVK
jgi:hypothetical protein